MLQPTLSDHQPLLGAGTILSAKWDDAVPQRESSSDMKLLITGSVDYLEWPGHDVIAVSVFPIILTRECRHLKNRFLQNSATLTKMTESVCSSECTWSSIIISSIHYQCELNGHIIIVLISHHYWQFWRKSASIKVETVEACACYEDWFILVLCMLAHCLQHFLTISALFLTCNEHF